MPKTTKKKPPKKPVAKVRKAVRRPAKAAPQKHTLKHGQRVTHTETEQRGIVRLLAENYIGVTMSDGTRADWARKWVKRV